AMDKRTSMGVLGDLNKFTQYQAAEAMREAANNPNGAAGMSAGFGAAAMMTQAMQFSMQQNQQPVQQAAPQQTAAPAGDTKFCMECGARIPKGAKFCSECGAKQG
ncbi:MAG: zinc-ribbon domain-containing protein, partial [Clostridia bacterium]|nr:zinc-ribbon domain-containing protein [Clostridia bacterium]